MTVSSVCLRFQGFLNEDASGSEWTAPADDCMTITVK